uniref:Retrotran_gag_3 domain-containing protein n=1 Tax=Strongyloides venezuelensis TaxID=75913 RepID=A0A0K0FDD7_STRVS
MRRKPLPLKLNSESESDFFIHLEEITARTVAPVTVTMSNDNHKNKLPNESQNSQVELMNMLFQNLQLLQRQQKKMLETITQLQNERNNRPTAATTVATQRLYTIAPITSELKKFTNGNFSTWYQRFSSYLTVYGIPEDDVLKKHHFRLMLHPDVTNDLDD